MPVTNGDMNSSSFTSNATHESDPVDESEDDDGQAPTRVMSDVVDTGIYNGASRSLNLQVRSLGSQAAPSATEWPAGSDAGAPSLPPPTLWLGPSSATSGEDKHSSPITPRELFVELESRRDDPEHAPGLAQVPIVNPEEDKKDAQPVSAPPALVPNPATPSSQPKKRGRPKGWKPGMSYAEMRGGSPAKEQKKPSAGGAPRGEAKRRGRPPRPPEISARERYLRSNPEYIPFKCEWEFDLNTCPAELHNMKTLRRHVFLVHGDADEPEKLTCRWGECARSDPKVFKDQDEFEEHMEETHLEPYVWHMGDGPQNDGIEVVTRNTGAVPSYLLDQDGKQVTPSIKDQRYEDAHGYRDRRRKLRELLLQKEENAPFEEEFLEQPLSAKIS